MTLQDEKVYSGGMRERRDNKGGVFYVWEDDMPRMQNGIENCVIYLYPSVLNAEAGRKVGGSGFLVGVKSKAHKEITHMYAVSNKHVVRGFGHIDPAPVIRINSPLGNTRVIELDQEDWFDHPDEDDLAVCLLNLPTHTYRYAYIPLELFLSKLQVKAFNIGLGDDVFLVGRFINHEGQQRNTPTVQYGIISMMPEEKILHPDGHMQESYLVECRSMGGYSGSPVFVYGNKSRFYKGAPETTKAQFFLGVNWGHLMSNPEPVLIKQQEDDPETGLPLFERSDEFYARYNTGMAKVIPSWRLHDFLDSERLVMQREEADRQITREKNRSPVELDSASEEYRNFEAGLKQVLSVSKEELDRRVQADKQQRQKKRK